MNPMDFLKNFKDIQAQMTQMQDKLKDITIVGSSGGGMVQITMNGQMQIEAVKIDPEVVDPADVGMLEDLVLAASRDAFNKLKDTLQQEMSGMTGGFPAGFPGL